MLNILKALADPIRLRLLAILARGEQTVQDLTVVLGLGQSRISHHLKVLLEAGLLAVQPQGTWKYYRLAPEGEFLQQLWPVIAARLETVAGATEDLQSLNRLHAHRRQQSKDFFETHARKWDTMARKLLPTADYAGELLAVLGGGDRLIEVGVGTGELLPRLASDWSRIIGIDQSQAMLEMAGQRSFTTGDAAIELRLGEMSHLPVADAQADAVLMNMVLHHATQPLQVLAETVRVLRPGGKLVIADLVRHSQDWARESLADVWLGFTDDELRGWLVEAGFVDISIQHQSAASGQQEVLLASGRRSNL